MAANSRLVIGLLVACCARRRIDGSSETSSASCEYNGLDGSACLSAKRRNRRATSSRPSFGIFGDEFLDAQIPEVWQCDTELLARPVPPCQIHERLLYVLVEPIPDYFRGN